MSTLAVPKLLTVADLEAMPDDGMDRCLIRGQLREKPLTKRNRWHSSIEARIAQQLWNWVDQQPEPRGVVASGEAGCILRRNPDTSVGIDVAYFSAEVAARQPVETTMFNEPPILAVEILSPSDTQEEINEKLVEYLGAGVPLIWIVEPRFRTVQVFRPGHDPELFNVRQDLVGDSILPGFRVAVSRLFP